MDDLVLDAQQPYLLGCRLFVGRGRSLNISAGTTIVALASSPTSAPAIVIEQGANIIAQGTRSQPITFTALDSQTQSPELITTDSRVAEGLVAGRRGRWGGLVLLGRAPTNVPGGVGSIEGLAAQPYGGTDPHDSSGVLRYVRVWHAGATVDTDVEINGLTLGGVGDGTLLEHVEVAFSLDDAFEFFGGTVNIRCAHLSLCAPALALVCFNLSARASLWFPRAPARRAPRCAPPSFQVRRGALPGGRCLRL